MTNLRGLCYTLIMEDKLTIQLCDSILVWWEEHQYDTYDVDTDDSGTMESENVYDIAPEFLVLAKRLKSKEINDNK